MRKTFAETVCVKNAVKSTKIGNDGAVHLQGAWSVVGGNKRKQTKHVISGTAECDSLRATVKPIRRKCVGVFVTGLHPNTTVEQVASHVNDNIDINVECVKLNAKFNTYSSFLVKIDHKNMHKILAAHVWPKDTLIKKYYESSK